MRTFLYIVFLVPPLLFSCGGEKTSAPSLVAESVQSDPLPSWNNGTVKDALIGFVGETTDTSSQSFIPENERIAVFDNDGTLWAEKPFYFQLAYALDFVEREFVNHPEWADDDLVKAALVDDLHAIIEGGEKALLELVMLSHAKMTREEFAKSVQDWITTAKHPETGRSYQDMTYQPMLELLEYLRAHGYKTFIVSGGGVDFIRVWSEEVYGIPPYQVVGSSIKAKYLNESDQSTVVKLPELNFIDDGPGKPVGIHQYIGMRPVIAVGNSDGDFEMLEYTTNGPGARLGLLIHHTDSVREFAYDSLSHIGRLRRGLEAAQANGWVLVDMSKDWARIFPMNE